jgi:hypothetical protein
LRSFDSCYVIQKSEIHPSVSPSVGIGALAGPSTQEVQQVRGPTLTHVQARRHASFRLVVTMGSLLQSYHPCNALDSGGSGAARLRALRPPAGGCGGLGRPPQEISHRLVYTNPLHRDLTIGANAYIIYPVSYRFGTGHRCLHTARFLAPTHFGCRAQERAKGPRR